MTKIYRTAKGKSVNLDELRSANESKVAVGNMRVNARGDELGPGGHVIRNVAQRARVAQSNIKQTATNRSIKPQQVGELPKTAAAEPAGDLKTRDDGSQYTESFDESGNIVTNEVRNASRKKKKNTTQETNSDE